MAYPLSRTEARIYSAAETNQHRVCCDAAPRGSSEAVLFTVRSVEIVAIELDDRYCRFATCSNVA